MQNLVQLVNFPLCIHSKPKMYRQYHPVPSVSLSSCLSRTESRWCLIFDLVTYQSHKTAALNSLLITLSGAYNVYISPTLSFKVKYVKLSVVKYFDLTLIYYLSHFNDALINRCGNCLFDWVLQPVALKYGEILNLLNLTLSFKEKLCENF